MGCPCAEHGNDGALESRSERLRRILIPREVDLFGTDPADTMEADESEIGPPCVVVLVFFCPPDGSSLFVGDRLLPIPSLLVIFPHERIIFQRRPDGRDGVGLERQSHVMVIRPFGARCDAEGHLFPVTHHEWLVRYAELIAVIVQELVQAATASFRFFSGQ